MKNKKNISSCVISTKDFFVTQESFDLVRFRESEILKTVPVPNDLTQYYDSDEYLSHDDSDTSLFARCYNIAKRINLKTKTKWIGRCTDKGNILDIGAGLGDLVAHLNDRGFNALGFEPNDKARKHAAAKGVKLLGNTDHIKDNSMAVITMFHVLEHVPDFNAQINQVLQWLQPGGYLIVALPNYDSLDSKWFKQYWAGYDVPRHLFHFNQSAVKSVFKNKMQLVTTYPMWFDSFYVSILSARYKQSKWPFIYGLIVGALSNLSALFTKQSSSIVYVLKKPNKAI